MRVLFVGCLVILSVSLELANAECVRAKMYNAETEFAESASVLSGIVRRENPDLIARDLEVCRQIGVVDAAYRELYDNALQCDDNHASVYVEIEKSGGLSETTRDVDYFCANPEGTNYREIKLLMGRVDRLPDLLKKLKILIGF